MCGRYTLRTNLAQIGQLLLPSVAVEDFTIPELKPRFNIAPTQSAPVVVCENPGGSRCLMQMRWGLVPPWSNDLSIGAGMINARSETVDEKKSFKKSFASRRCLVPADGYFEWMQVDDGKQPYLMHRKDDALFVMAGIWEINKRVHSDKSPLYTFSIITTSTNEVTGRVHDRMPVILAAEDHETWLDPTFSDIQSLKTKLVAAPVDLLEITAVSRHVNNARFDDSECVKPV